MTKRIKCWICLLESCKELNTNNYMLMPSVESDYYEYSICNNCPYFLWELYKSQFNPRTDLTSQIEAQEEELQFQDISSTMDIVEDKRLAFYRQQLCYNQNLSDVKEAMEFSIKNGTIHSNDYPFAAIEKYKLYGEFDIKIYMALIKCSITPYIMINNDIEDLKKIVLSNIIKTNLDFVDLFVNKIDENDNFVKLVTFSYNDLNNFENSGEPTQKMIYN